MLSTAPVVAAGAPISQQTTIWCKVDDGLALLFTQRAPHQQQTDVLPPAFFWRGSQAFVQSIDGQTATPRATKACVPKPRPQPISSTRLPGTSEAIQS
jgi:hypothetical protein